MNKIIEEDLLAITERKLDWGKFANSTVLVAGAYGLLGTYIVYTLLFLNKIIPRLNIKVVALGRNKDKILKTFKQFSGDCHLQILEQDIVNGITIAKDVDYIFHAAGLASSQFYGTDPVGVIAPNVVGTWNLLRLAKEKRSRGFVFLSSGEACGKIEKDAIIESDIGILDPGEIRSCYGESKRMGENLLKSWGYQYGISTFSARLGHVYGPTMDLTKDKRVYAEFVSDVIHNKDIAIKSDGTAVRDFCYMTDVIDGLFRVLLKGVPGETYNISNNNARMSIKELAALLVSLRPEKKLKVIYSMRDDNNEYLENKNKRQPALLTGKIEKLGYKSTTDAREGFERTITSYEMEIVDNKYAEK